MKEFSGKMWSFEFNGLYFSANSTYYATRSDKERGSFYKVGM